MLIPKNKNFIIILCAIIFLICLYLSVFSGHINIHISELFSKDSEILNLIRIPRAIKAIIAGSCLALSGLFLQTITKNPLVEPYITGISSGAGIALVLGILFNISAVYYPWMAFIGAILSAIIVILFAGVSKFSMVKLILMGMSINIFAGSIISLLILTNYEKAFSMTLVLTGNLSNCLSDDRYLLAMFFLTLLIVLIFIPRLNFLRIDNKIASSIDSNSTKYVFLFVLLSAILASISVYAAGILGFVGLIIPHISRMLISLDFRRLFFVNILLGSSIVLLADFIARNVIYPMEIPIGAILALIGAPVLVTFLIMRGNRFYA